MVSALAPLDGKLAHLGLHGFVATPSLVGALAAALPRLATLTLVRCPLPDGALVALVRLLPRLRRLNLEADNQMKPAFPARFAGLCRGTSREIRVEVKGVAYDEVEDAKKKALAEFGPDQLPPEVQLVTPGWESDEEGPG